MSTSISVPSISTSPPFDHNGERRLAGSVIPCANLTAAERKRMYALLDSYFVGTTRARFETDLAEKKAVILLRDRQDQQIQGFSTLLRMTVDIEGTPIVAFFSGDTIIAREYWGDTLLSRLWSQTIFAEADRIKAQESAARVYWFLICSGYKTWRFLPVFFREFYPHPDSPTPAKIKLILDTLGERKFGRQYFPDSGVVRFDAPTPLRCGIADITEQRLRDAWIAFFNRVNPGHTRGDELACLAEIAHSNLTRAGERMLGRKVFAQDY